MAREDRQELLRKMLSCVLSALATRCGWLCACAIYHCLCIIVNLQITVGMLASTDKIPSISKWDPVV